MALTSAALRAPGALARDLQPAVVIPCHNDLFPDGMMPARALWMNLLLHGMQDRFHTLRPGEPWVYAPRGQGRETCTTDA